VIDITTVGDKEALEVFATSLNYVEKGKIRVKVGGGGGKDYLAGEYAATNDDIICLLFPPLHIYIQGIFEQTPQQPQA